MPPTDPRYKTVRVPTQMMERLHAAAEALDVSVNAVVVQAGSDLSQVIQRGWRPKNLIKGGAKCFLPLRLEPDRYQTWVTAAEAGKISISDFLRIAAVAGLYEIEAKKRVLWPLKLGRDEFSAATKWAEAKGWA